MPTYHVAAKLAVSCWTVVEADSPEEAQAIAAKRDVADFHIDGTYPEDECWNFENDGTPFDLRIEDAP